MPNRSLSGALARLEHALAGRPDADVSDGRLLSRFVASGDEAAFAALVDRLGPMVLAICRRTAGETHIAEDAFQAAFLVLARRAADVRPREAVRAWMYGVAVRTALEARTAARRRRSRERPMPTVPDRPTPDAAPADADTLRVLDEEIARLPDHLRVAVVLCELDGVSRRDAAARLAIPEGTLSSRLGKARKVLADRLRVRGVASAAAALGALLSQAAATARVPAALAASAASLTSSEAAPVAVSQLTHEVMRAMLLRKLAVGAAAVAGTVAVTFGLAWVAGTGGLREARDWAATNLRGDEPVFAERPPGGRRLALSSLEGAAPTEGDQSEPALSVVVPETPPAVAEPAPVTAAAAPIAPPKADPVTVVIVARDAARVIVRDFPAAGGSGVKGRGEVDVVPSDLRAVVAGLWPDVGGGPLVAPALRAAFGTANRDEVCVIVLLGGGPAAGDSTVAPRRTVTIVRQATMGQSPSAANPGRWLVIAVPESVGGGGRGARMAPVDRIPLEAPAHGTEVGMDG